MKKIITALANSTLNTELCKYSKYDVLLSDLLYQEAVLDTEVTDVDVIILSSLLQGQFEMIDFIDKVRERFPLSRVILIVSEISNENKNILISKGVFDILYDSEIEISTVLDAIDREDNIKTRINMVKEIEQHKYNAQVKSEEVVYVNKVQKQEIITFAGAGGSGKTTTLVNFAKVLTRKTNSKVLIIDLDTMSGMIDESLKIEKFPNNIEMIMEDEKRCGLNYCVELIIKNRFNSNVLEELVIRKEGIDILTGNNSIYVCQNILKSEYYQTILDVAKEMYDFILIDTNGSIFLDSTKWAIQRASRVFVIAECNYMSMRKTNQLLDVYINTWKTWKEKFQLVINKYTLSSELEIEVFEKLASTNVIGIINRDEFDSEKSYIKILENINYVPRRTVIDKVCEVKENITSYISKLRHKSKEVKNVN